MAKRKNDVYDVVVANNGRVGIGMLQPSQTLVINGDMSVGIVKPELTLGGGTLLSFLGATEFGTGVFHPVFVVEGIQNRVGLDIENPQYTLDVGGAVRIQGSLLPSVFRQVSDSEPIPMPLKELEVFVKSNKHLPEIPSAKEMLDNGLGLIELQHQLQKKVDGLTVYKRTK